MTTWYSPATSAVMYVDIRSVGAKRHIADAVAGRSGCGSGVGEFDMTFQSAGAVT